MSLAQFKIRATHDDYGRICPDCAGPKVEQHRRCRACWAETLRTEAYWASRTCPDCGGPKTRQARVRRCRPCANLLLAGKPRSTPVVVPADHIWRRKRLAASVGGGGQ